MKRFLIGLFWAAVGGVILVFFVHSMAGVVTRAVKAEWSAGCK